MRGKATAAGVKGEDAPGFTVTDIAFFQSVQMTEARECVESMRSEETVELAFGKAERGKSILHYQYKKTDVTKGNIGITPW